MPWHDIKGHDEIAERFRRCVRRGRLASTFLFVGPNGIGKRTFALEMAKALLCETHAEADFAACGTCPACIQVSSLTHSDLEYVCRPEDKTTIPVEMFIGDREHRMREGLLHRIGLKAFQGGRKIAIIDDADTLNLESANCLLKTLEEPPPRCVVILIGTSLQRQLPTIRSRCQVIRFSPLAQPVVAELLARQQLVDDPTTAERLAALAHGSLERAVDMKQEGLLEFRDGLFSRLSAPEIDGIELQRDLTQFAESAGKNTADKRLRIRHAADFAGEFFQQLARRLAGSAVVGDRSLVNAVENAYRHWQSGPASAGRCVDRCLAVLGHVDANANPATLLECWADELSTMMRIAHAGREPVGTT
jgi:DNA polymerase-3 subunit delta'